MANLYNKTILDNGLRVITVPMENANSVTVLILVGTGSKYETKEINGISHFLEHMFFKGTLNRPSTLKIAESLDSVGGQYNAFTSKEITGFWAKVDKKHFDTALDWISDIFLNSKFEAKEIEREKGVIIEEINMYLDTPTAYVGELWEELLYGNQPAGWKVIGEKENITNFNRKKILDYYQSKYSPSNTVICIAGNINQANALEKTKTYFGKTAKKLAPRKVVVREKQSQPNILLYNKKTDQTHFCLGVRAYNIFDPRRYTLSLLAIILGGNMSSRLFTKVRERNGLAYSIHTSADKNPDTGYLVTQAGIDYKNLGKTIKLILEEYKKLKNKKVAKRELQKAKDYLKGITSLSLDASDAQASFYAIQELLEDRVSTLEEKFKRIDEISVDDINKVAQDIFVPHKLNLAVLGQVREKDSDKIKKILKI